MYTIYAKLPRKEFANSFPQYNLNNAVTPFSKRTSVTSQIRQQVVMSTLVKHPELLELSGHLKLLKTKTQGISNLFESTWRNFHLCG